MPGTDTPDLFRSVSDILDNMRAKGVTINADVLARMNGMAPEIVDDRQNDRRGAIMFQRAK